ncbi:hypothetical protein ZWY2020_009474 [Hordeum vulgare]|nr:hypothetical protein ZWY2020_009474 [Hordeum vulgare]
MWHYPGAEDTTQTHPEKVSENTDAQWLRSITGACDNPLGAKRIMPFSAANQLLNHELTNMYSPVPNGEQPDEGEESAHDSANVDFAEDIEGGDDDSEESEEEVRSPARIEHQPKQREDPAAVPSRTLASSTRNSKPERAATSESTKKAAKRPRSDAPKPRKALPRMKITRVTDIPNIR